MSYCTLEPELLDSTSSDFNPRYLDIHTADPAGTPTYNHVNDATNRQDFINLSGRCITIGFRDGGIIMIKPSKIDLSGHEHYELPNEIRLDGEYRKLGRHRSLCRVPDVSPGLYIKCMRRASGGANDNEKDRNRIHRKRISIDGREELDYGDIFNGAYNNPVLTPKIHERFRDQRYSPDQIEPIKGPACYRGVESRYIANSVLQRSGRYYETVMAEFVIHQKDLDKMARQGIDIAYIESLDIVISVSLPPDEVYHPYSKEGRKHMSMQKHREQVEEETTPLSSISFTSIVNDEDSTPTKKYYVNLGGPIIEVNHREDPNMPDGIYIYKKTDGGIQQYELTHDEAETHENVDLPRFYGSKAAAITHGSPEAILLERKRKFEQEKLKAEQQAYQDKQDLERLKDENMRLKLETDAKNLELQKRTAVISAVTKTAVPIIMMAAGLYSLWRKSR